MRSIKRCISGDWSIVVLSNNKKYAQLLIEKQMAVAKKHNVTKHWTTQIYWL